MSTYEKTVLQPLLADSILALSNYRTLARLLPHVVEKRYHQGEHIFREGEPAEHLYLLLDGRVRLESAEQTRILMRDPEGNLVTMDARLAGAEPRKVTLNSGRFGEESGTDTPDYISDAVATTAVSALMIPRSKLRGLLLENPRLRAEFYRSLMNRFTGEPVQRRQPRAEAKATPPSDWRAVFGWLCAIVFPALTLVFAPRMGLDNTTTAFLAVMAATIMMWAFELMDEYVPALFAMLSILILRLVPAPVALAGFSSEGFFIAMSILGLGALIVASGLSYRFLLLLLNYLPNSQFWHHAGVFFTGILLTPVVPSSNARIALVGPFLTDMADILRVKPRSRGATELAVACFGGATIFSPVFLTSKSVNFIVLGLLSAQAQQTFSWLGWAMAGAVYGAVMLLAYASLATLMFRRDTPGNLSKDRVAAQLKLLGGLKNRELAAIAGILLFSISVVTTSVHRISASWLGLAILYGLLLFGFLRKNEFKERIDWTLLVYLGGLGAIMGTFGYLGLDHRLAEHLTPLGAYLRSDIRVFILLVFGLLLLLRLILPINAAIVICAAILMPLAEPHGIHPWVVGFIVLVFGEIWIIPYQCSYYRPFKEMSAGSADYDEKTFLQFNLILNAVKILAVLASLPLWAGEGLL